MPVLKKKQLRISSARTMLLGFTGIILLGAFLLFLPVSSSDGKIGDFIVCLFTSTSATCVTGLTLYDTYSHWSYFGQGVIMALMQVGGLGFLTLVTFFNLTMGKKLGWNAVKNAASDFTDNALQSTKRLFYEIVLYSFGIELVGAAVLGFVFVPQYGGYGVFMSLFTSVSAFCNAGFDVFGITQGTVSASGYISQPAVTITVMLLSVMGGLGFAVWQNLVHYRRTKRLTLHTKTVLITSGLLVLFGAVIFFLSEFANPDTTGGMGLGEKTTAAFFLSVNARSAGFSCVETASLMPFSRIVLTCLMFVGSAPASTGGGLKVTTLSILLATVWSVLRGREETCLFGYKLKKDAVYKTLTVLVLSVAMVGAAFSLLMTLNPDIAVQDALFEVVAAFSTAGLSMGVTAEINDISRIVMIITMLAGRAGPVTLMMALMKIGGKPSERNKVLPEADILVG